MSPSDRFRAPALLFTALHLYSFATNSLIYFLPFWLALAISASIVFRTHVAATELAFNWSKAKGFRTSPADA